MVQAVTYQSDKQSVYFQGKLIVLENLTPVLSPEEKKKRKREIENNPYDIFSKYGDRFCTLLLKTGNKLPYLHSTVRYNGSDC